MKAKTQEERKKNTPFWKMIALLSIFCLFLGGFYGCSQKLDKKAMVTKIQKISELATVEFKLRKIIYAKSKEKFLFLTIGKATYLATVEPMIKAGIDISQIRADDINIDETTKIIKILLPPIKIIYYSFDTGNIEVDFNLTSDQIFCRLSLQNIEKVHRNADKDIRTYLNFLNIKEEAEKSTCKFFNEFFECIGYKGDIDFKKSDEPLIYFEMERENVEESK